MKNFGGFRILCKLKIYIIQDIEKFEKILNLKLNAFHPSKTLNLQKKFYFLINILTSRNRQRSKESERKNIEKQFSSRA